LLQSSCAESGGKATNQARKSESSHMIGFMESMN
jgi:hypothetical protein